MKNSCFMTIYVADKDTIGFVQWKAIGQQPGPGGFKQPKSKHLQLAKAGGNT